jgi:hypothetical protein
MKQKDKNSALSDQQLDRAESLLKQIATGIEKTQNGTGIFLLPLADPERNDELGLLKKVVDCRLIDIGNPECRNSEEFGHLLREFFSMMLGYVNFGDAWPPEPAEANNALRWLLENTLEEGV